ncbi:uncharacterized protein [Montipora foliosa]|uniref:uncharacterized protein n=1 Tax=Montipora foliosa TaxID=591990 RepID=UPI0035F1B5D1
MTNDDDSVLKDAAGLHGLIKCGDIEINPGPDQASSTSRKNPGWKFPCDVCTNPVRINQKGILCDGCNKWFHLRCITVDLKTYFELSSSDEQWFCEKCGWPFKFTDSFFETSFSTELNVISSSTSFVPVDSLPRSSNGFINYLLLNVRSLLSKINDLSALPLIDSFDIVAMTETWLNDDFSDSELQRDGYNIFGFDRANRRGGGVLLAINPRLSCNRRCDLDLGVEMLVLKFILGAQDVSYFQFSTDPNADEIFLDGFRAFLHKFNGFGISDLIITANEVNSSVESFQDLLFAAVNQHVPQTKLRRHSRPPCIDNDVMKLVRKKKSLWKRLKNNSGVDAVKEANKEVVSLKYSLYLKSLSENLKNNPKKFWSFHSLKSKIRRIPPVVTYKLKSASDPAEKASLFKEFLSSVFTSTSADHVTLRNDVTHPDLLMSVSTSAVEVQKILAKLDVNKATGADNIPARILKKCFRELSHPLSTLFNMSFRLCVVPQEWKRFNVTPVFKSDNKNSVENYRSVSL